MKNTGGQIIVVELYQSNKVFHDFLEMILARSYVSEMSGQLVCKKCKVELDIDWFEKTAECMCDDM